MALAEDDDSLAGVCHANFTLLELFASKILYFALPPDSTSSLSLQICIWTLTYHSNVIGKF